MNTKPYVIKSTEPDTDGSGDQLYWSNEWGWVGLDEATRFNVDELDEVYLPVGGEWRQLR